MNQIAYFPEQDSVALPNGSVEVVSRSEAMQYERWAKTLNSEAKDRRYYELVEDTIHEEFDYRYFIVRDQTGEICAIQPFFVLDLDLLTGAKPLFGRLTDFVRRLWPGFMRARTLMVGCAAGEGHLDGKDELAQRCSARLLASALVQEARKLKARMVVLKEFPAKYRPALECFVDEDFTRIPSLPNVMLNINYSSFEEYMRRALSGNTRKQLRLKLKVTDQAPPIEMSVVNDITPMIDEIYPLYLQVYHRSNLQFREADQGIFLRARAPVRRQEPFLRLAPRRQGHRLRFMPAARRYDPCGVPWPRLYGRTRAALIPLHVPRPDQLGDRERL